MKTIDQELKKKILKAAGPLSAWAFARDVANELQPGINYKGSSKKNAVDSMLEGRYGRPVNEEKLFKVIDEALRIEESRKEYADAEKEEALDRRGKAKAARKFLSEVCERLGIDDDGFDCVYEDDFDLASSTTEKVKLTADVTTDQLRVILAVLGFAGTKKEKEND